MRPKKHRTTGSGDLFRARLDQIINMKHELVQLAGKVDRDWIDGEIAPLYSENGRPGIATRFMIGLLLLKHIYGLSDEGLCERWVHDPYFQYFTGEEFFQHAFPHERSDLSHWRKRLGDKLELLLAESLRVAHETGALRSQDLKRVGMPPSMIWAGAGAWITPSAFLNAYLGRRVTITWNLTGTTSRRSDTSSPISTFCLPACSASSSGSMTISTRSRWGAKPLRRRGARLLSACARPLLTRALIAAMPVLDLLEGKGLLFNVAIRRVELFRWSAEPRAVEGLGWLCRL
ncbi:hypothetical protein ACVIM8_001388 [Bradyrhizobium sp. USDA 4529]